VTKLTAWDAPESRHRPLIDEQLKLLRDTVIGSCPWDGSGYPGDGTGSTMIGALRLDNFRAAIEHVVVHQVPGDIIECGVWRGGACIFARGVLNALESDRCVFVADSFQGLPRPDARYPADSSDEYHAVSWLRVSQQTVRDNFVKLGLLDGVDGEATAATDRARGVVFLPGFFEESLTAQRLTAAKLDKLAVLRLDGDMYSSTMQIFEALYDHVSVGGVIIVDDYSGSACRQAVHDFREKRGITSEIQPIDWAGSWWIKENP
jgi:O-methyltransferase